MWKVPGLYTERQANPRTRRFEQEAQPIIERIGRVKDSLATGKESVATGKDSITTGQGFVGPKKC